MRFRKLRLTGFKSFVEPAELLIEPGLTGVVGPNGCGKSNLLEAIRWVMGEGSPKSLRGGGMEDVIFAGTASRPARDFAEVMLGIEDQDGEHDIVRRIERGTGSAYRIDGRDVRQRDVALLFADAATGAHSPALVSQGRIAGVIAAKPVERRQMLEEAAGIAGLHVRRREAELKLRATEANLMRLDELLGGMEARAGALRRQAKAAERYRALSSEIRLAEARSLFARWREAARAAEQGRAEADAAAQAVNTAAEAQRAGAAHLTQATALLAEARHAAEKAREAAGAIRYRREALQNEKAGIERRLAELAAHAIAVERDRMREDALAVDAAAALEQLVAEEDGLARTKTAAEKQRGPLDQAVIEAERALLECELQAAQALARASAEQAELRVADAALAAARQQKVRADADLARLADEIMALGDEQALLAQRHAAAQARAEVEARLSEANSQSTEAEAERDRASAAREAAETTSAAARAALATLESEARALRAALARETGTGVIAALTVDAGYERALAAALGDDLEAPIGADAGRGWVGASPQKGDPSLPQGVQALSQHVRGDAVLARRLAQVGVVENDAGQPLAVGQRLVTRAGALRRWDGFIARESGAAAAERLLRANRLTTLETLVGQAEIAVADAAGVLAVAAERNGAARAAIETVRKQLARTEGALSAARRDEDRTAHAIERREAAERALNVRRGVVEQAAREADAGLTRAEAAMAALPDGAASRLEVDRLGATTATARAQLVEARSRAFALAQGIANDERRIEAARGEAKGWRSRAGDAARRIAEMGKRTASIEDERASLAGRPAAIDADLAAVAAQSGEADQAAQQAREIELAQDADARRLEGQATQAGEALATAREVRAGAQARAEHQELRRAELSQQSGERFDCPAAVLADKIGFEASSLAPAQDEAARHERLLVDRERLGPVNLVAASELAELEDVWTASACERDELGQAVNRLRGSIGALNREGRQRLLAAFEAVDGHFRRLFTTLFAGGEAHLALIDSGDPLDAGLEIMAQPPGKKLGSLTLLSGGEQALTAIALIFALFLTNPAPICVLDEVDAPLDDANIERFCDLLTAMTRETDTRYLIVTHNAVTMSRMHRLFGVTMIERGISRLVSVDLGRAETLLAAE